MPFGLGAALGARAFSSEARRRHLMQLPDALLAVFGPLGDRDLAQAVLPIELEDAQALQHLRVARLAHVDERAFVLEPEARLQVLADHRGERADLGVLRLLVRERRDPLAQHEGQDDERHADLEQDQRSARRREPRAAHHRVLGVAGEVRKHVERADQHHDRKELVGMCRRVEQHEREHLAQVVLALAEVAELADQVEEGKQREEAEQHEARRAVDLLGEVALERARADRHLPSPSRISCMRWPNSTTSSSTMPPCTSQTPVEKSRRPCATRAWLTESRLEYTMKVSSANSRLAERPARGLTKLIGIASSTSTSADTGMPTRQRSSARFSFVGLAISPQVVRFFWLRSGSMFSRVSIRPA